MGVGAGACLSRGHRLLLAIRVCSQGRSRCPSVLSSMPISIEQHVEWISDCLASLREHDLQSIEPRREAEDAWVAHVNQVASAALFPLANSCYIGANIPGKPRVFMPYVGGVGSYRKICSEVAAKGYEGFTLTPARVAVRELASLCGFRSP